MSPPALARCRQFAATPHLQDRLRRTNELVDRLAQSEARASEAEKQAQQKEADLKRKLEELALAEERAISAVSDDDDFSHVQASAGEPPQFRADSAAAAPFSKLDELRCTKGPLGTPPLSSGSCWLVSAACTCDDLSPTRYATIFLPDATTFLPDDLTSVLPVAAGLSVAAAVAVGSVALNAKVGETPLTHPSPNTQPIRPKEACI